MQFTIISGTVRNLARSAVPFPSLNKGLFAPRLQRIVPKPNTKLIPLIMRALLCNSKRTIFVYFYTPILRSAEADGRIYDASHNTPAILPASLSRIRTKIGEPWEH